MVVACWKTLCCTVNHFFLAKHTTTAMLQRSIFLVLLVTLAYSVTFQVTTVAPSKLTFTSDATCTQGVAVCASSTNDYNSATSTKTTTTTVKPEPIAADDPEALSIGKEQFVAKKSFSLLKNLDNFARMCTGSNCARTRTLLPASRFSIGGATLSKLAPEGKKTPGPKHPQRGIICTGPNCRRTKTLPPATRYDIGGTVLNERASALANALELLEAHLQNGDAEEDAQVLSNLHNVLQQAM